MGRAAVAIAWVAMSACGFNSATTTDAGRPMDTIAPPADGAPDATPDSALAGEGARRKPIVIASAQVTGTQGDFPVWIDLTDADIAARARADGTDIFFTASDGSALDYEIQRWNMGAKQLMAWVRLPSLSHDADTTIYVEYGDIAKATPPNPHGVFKSSFAAVWHLDDSLSSTSVVDTTSACPGTATSLAPSDQVPSQLGGGIKFDGGGTEMISFANPLTGSTPHTISVWVNEPAATHTSAIVVVGTAATDQSRFLYSYAGNGHGSSVGVGQYSDDWYPSNIDLETTGWTLIAWTYEGPNKKQHLFRNGVEVGGGDMLNAAAATVGSTGLIGYAPAAYGPTNGMLGTIDELRIATVQRDPTWLATEYANQSTPSTFYTVGAEQVAP
jgi:biopolymer transport protein ExbB